MPHLTAAHRYLVIAGTPRAGTTSLYEYLRDHPQVCASTIKETRFFLDGDYPLASKYRSDDGLACYEEYFARCPASSVRMEATPHYLYSAGTPARLAARLPEAFVVISLREPVARLVSCYRFARQTDRLAADESFDTYCERQLDGSLQPDPPQHFRALEQGLYPRYVRRFREALGAERVLVTYCEELAREPRGVMNAICRFAGLDEAAYDNYEFVAHNRTQAVRSSFVHRWYLSTRDHVTSFTHDKPAIQRPLRALRRAVEPWYLRANRRGDVAVRCTQATAERLAVYYADVAEDLRALLGQHPPWQEITQAVARLTNDKPSDP